MDNGVAMALRAIATREPLEMSLIAADPEYQPGKRLMDEMASLGLAEYGKIKPDVRALIS